MNGTNLMLELLFVPVAVAVGVLLVGNIAVTVARLTHRRAAADKISHNLYGFFWFLRLGGDSHRHHRAG